MPYVNKPRPYAKEYAQYDGTPAVKKKRAQRNKARRMLEAEGVVHKGDGKDVDHKNGKTSDNNMGNLRAVPKSKNRSYPRTKTAGKK